VTAIACIAFTLALHHHEDFAFHEDCPICVALRFLGDYFVWQANLSVYMPAVLILFTHPILSIHTLVFFSNPLYRGPPV
jgi:hypothetical protein